MGKLRLGTQSWWDQRQCGVWKQVGQTHRPTWPVSLGNAAPRTPDGKHQGGWHSWKEVARGHRHCGLEGGRRGQDRIQPGRPTLRLPWFRPSPSEQPASWGVPWAPSLLFFIREPPVDRPQSKRFVLLTLGIFCTLNHAYDLYAFASSFFQ